MADSVFHKDAGRILSVREAQPLKDTYYNAKLATGLKGDDVTRSEFFGIDKIMQLLKQDGCVGLRVHYAKRWEDEAGKATPTGVGQLKSRVLLTGVDARGHDILKDGTVGLKDDGNGGNPIVGDGYSCPQHCPSGN